jgi:hypothetical protein
MPVAAYDIHAFDLRVYLDLVADQCRFMVAVMVSLAVMRAAQKKNKGNDT